MTALPCLAGIQHVQFEGLLNDVSIGLVSGTEQAGCVVQSQQRHAIWAFYEALTLAQLHAAGLLDGIWVPPREGRDLRMLISQRRKMVCLATTAKNRLHAALHRHHLAAPPSSLPFSAKHEAFWLSLPVSASEREIIHSDWQTVVFAEQQKKALEQAIGQAMADDPRAAPLARLPGRQADQRGHAAGGHRRYRALLGRQAPGWLCRAGRPRARLGAHPPWRAHHQGRPQGHSLDHGRGRSPCPP